MRTVIVSLAVLAALMLAPTQPLRVATGLTAHLLCSERFIAGRDPDRVYDDYIAPTIGRIASTLTAYAVDEEDKEVRVGLAGAFRSRAVFAEGRGCTLIHGANPPEAARHADLADGDSGFLSQVPQEPVVPRNPGIAAALDIAFAEEPGAPRKGRRAIVIVQDGKIIAERYAPGTTPETPLLSWSVAKSVTNALVGVLVQQGRLDPRMPAPVAAWSSEGDPRRTITIEQLLRQTSGQPFGSDNSGFDRATEMLFKESDMAAFAADAEFSGAPGKQWSYTDGNYAILSGIIRDTIGGNVETIARFSHDMLFGPIGMVRVTQEFDESGSPMGATHVYASARDWARFGLLYLNGGSAGDKRILPAGWTEYSARPTPVADAGYGAGFWTNAGDSEGAALRRGWGMPPGSYFASGHSGQTILIAPAEKLVVVSFGFSLEEDRISTERAARLTNAILKALKREM